ncbi:hypothetical protein [Serinibacter salmoneus]|uniref:Uncharacterized protein n=1 Tax=Serinibacter salmoneus TaxID=556530 RepID=A0A2A9D1Z7_9MICO|nr:hypothetical protein [Serinibacter salmoneus]PFG19879.1 hypothetical protein ATL40_1455 [Serinibacter salmoneus]
MSRSVGVALPGVSNPLWAAAGDPLSSSRITRFWVETLTPDELSYGILDGVTGGSVEFSASARVKASGSITLHSSEVPAQPWLTMRLRPWMSVTAGGQEFTWPLGVYLPSASTQQWTETGLTLPVELIDKVAVLDDDKLESTLALAAGSVVTDEVRALISGAGEYPGSVTDSDATLRSAQVWEAGTPRLTVINDLLATINYRSLFCDGYGSFRVEPYQRPAARPLRYDLLDDASSIYSPEFTIDEDMSSIPNRVVAIASTAESEPMVAVAENLDYSSPYSIGSRGRVIAPAPAQVEATDQAALDGIARRRLIEASTPTQTVAVSILPVPLELLDAVRLRNQAAAHDERHSVQSIRVEFDPLALMTVQLQRVVDL